MFYFVFLKAALLPIILYSKGQFRSTTKYYQI